MYKCLCDCGAVKIVRGKDLKSGHTKSCGCYNREKVSERSRIDITGQRFNRYLVLEFDSIRNGRVYYKCLCDCGTIKVVCGGNLKRGNTESCGCLRNERVSEASYNPDITDEERRHGRFYPEYKTWRIAVFERDNYTCQCCGKRGRKLAAHHLESYRDNPELRTVLENGITLCAEDKDCHGNFHHQYGKGDNTKEQFEGFLLAQRNLVEINKKEKEE